MRNLFVRSNVVVAVAAVLAAAASVTPVPAGASPPAEPEPRFTEACRRFQEGHVRSAARKLYRALRGEHTLQPLLLQPWIDASIQGRPVRFALHTEHEELVGGLVPEGAHHDTTYVVAQTASGPVVAAMSWEPAGGSCRVAASRLAYPPVAGDTVRPEPFRLWGQRVVWHVPREREADGARDPYAALVAVFRAESPEATGAPATAPQGEPEPAAEPKEPSARR